jgi:hypothetical protein
MGGEEKTLSMKNLIITKSLLHMVGQEEKKIRTDPAAQATDMLKTVFEK